MRITELNNTLNGYIAEYDMLTLTGSNEEAGEVLGLLESVMEDYLIENKIEEIVEKHRFTGEGLLN